jgi:hypothetical protein
MFGRAYASSVGRLGRGSWRELHQSSPLVALNPHNPERLQFMHPIRLQVAGLCMASMYLRSQWIWRVRHPPMASTNSPHDRHRRPSPGIASDAWARASSEPWHGVRSCLGVQVLRLPHPCFRRGRRCANGRGWGGGNMRRVSLHASLDLRLMRRISIGLPADPGSGLCNACVWSILLITPVFSTIVACGLLANKITLWVRRFAFCGRPDTSEDRPSSIVCGGCRSG